MNTIAPESPSVILPDTKLPRRPQTIHVPLYSWWRGKEGDRLFCIVGLGLDDKRWVLERGHSTDFCRPLGELQRLIREGLWLPAYD